MIIINNRQMVLSSKISFGFKMNLGITIWFKYIKDRRYQAFEGWQLYSQIYQNFKESNNIKENKTMKDIKDSKYTG